MPWRGAAIAANPWQSLVVRRAGALDVQPHAEAEPLRHRLSGRAATQHPVESLVGPLVPQRGRTSRHTGGVHALFCDGHVAFVGENISDVVWSGMGSRSGGEIAGEF